MHNPGAIAPGFSVFRSPPERRSVIHLTTWLRFGVAVVLGDAVASTEASKADPPGQVPDLAKSARRSKSSLVPIIRFPQQTL
jgi:hypothetical protein